MDDPHTVKYEVVWLDIAMNHTLFVRMLERGCNVTDNLAAAIDVAFGNDAMLGFRT
jgi:hypothetical protein